MSEQANGVRLAPDAADGKVYWRSMEQLAASPGYERILHNEFLESPHDAPTDAVSRRRFLGVVAAAVAMASTTACRKPVRKILPFASRPEDMTPGMPRHYATALQLGGYGTGVLVRSSDGRPTKVEGNALHPASLEATSLYSQGELLNLYDPARSKEPMADGVAAKREAFVQFWNGARGGLGDGDRLAFLMGPTTSPTLHHMVDEVKAAFPNASFHTYRPVNRDHEIEGARLAFGKALDPQYRFDAADVVVALDSDFMGADVNSVRHAHDWASRRRPAEDGVERLNRLYVAEPGHTVTGSKADHRFRVNGHRIADAMLGLAAELGVLEGPLKDAVAHHKAHGLSHQGKNWLRIVGEDLFEHRGRSIVIAGPRQPALVHAIAHALNAALGNVGNTVNYVAPPALVSENQADSLARLTDAMDHDRVDTLFILGGNPVADAPADLAFGDKLKKVKNRVHLGLYNDETAMACNWHVNAAHELEAWGDIRAYDGTISIQQPLIAPLYDGMSEIELLALVADYDEKEAYNTVRYYWDDNTRTEDFDAWWNRALHDGLIHGSAYATETATVRAADVSAEVAVYKRSADLSAQNLEVTFAPSATLYDGRYRNNAWMQECPDPVTKLTWDNAAVMSVGTAKALGVDNGDMLQLTVGGARLELPAWIVPGQADFSIALTLGYGQQAPEHMDVARTTGFDAYQVRSAASMTMAIGATATATGGSYELHSTQDHGSMEGRPHYREGDVSEFQANPDFAPMMSPLAKMAALKGKTEQDKLKSLWEERDYSTGYQWGMVIDLNSCNGCNACVVACQAENNVPSVGKGEVGSGREMHWLRIDRYYTGDSEEQPDEVDTVHQPVPCMQCENAPCESVCPVAATTHSPEGLNDMAYNRCIGTRYCSNNCPYKVRRFNYFDFIGKLDPSLQMVQNPDVTIRSRGVMEKCTYCVQRINGAKHVAKREDRLVMDGEIVPACGQVCPTKAITFGNIVDPESRVSKLRGSPLNYAMLSEYNVKPRTTYLAAIRNPNPKLS